MLLFGIPIVNRFDKNGKACKNFLGLMQAYLIQHRIPDGNPHGVIHINGAKVKIVFILQIVFVISHFSKYSICFLLKIYGGRLLVNACTYANSVSIRSFNL